MTQREKVLRLLRNSGEFGVTTGDFLFHCIPRFSARIMELKAEGYVISATRLREGSWRYRLEGLAEGEAQAGPVGVAHGRSDVSRSEGDPSSTVSPSASLFDLAPVSGTKSAVSGEWL